MNFLGIKETCIYMKDLDGARAFYHGILGLPVIAQEEGKHIFFRCGRSVLLCFNPDDSKRKQSPPAHYGSGKLHLAFEVAADNYAATRDKLLVSGIKITDEVTWQGGVKSFYFEDPEGNVLEVIPENGLWN
jgi:catechol 2,3-dioxygenase-like lactoylglutathione lyase family enzyme